MQKKVTERQDKYTFFKYQNARSTKEYNKFALASRHNTIAENPDNAMMKVDLF